MQNDSHRLNTLLPPKKYTYMICIRKQNINVSKQYQNNRSKSKFRQGKTCDNEEQQKNVRYQRDSTVTLSHNNTISCKLPDNCKVHCLVDSGCSFSIISKNTIRCSTYLSQITPTEVNPVKITIADGSSIRIDKSFTFDLCLGSTQISMTAYIVETIDLFSLLIGVNTLREIEGVIDIKGRCLKFRKPKNKNFKTMYTTTLEPYQTKHVRIFGKMPPNMKNAECTLKSTKFSNKFVPSLSLHKLNKGQTTLIMRNPSNKRIKIHKNACVATIDLSCTLGNVDKIAHLENGSKHTIMFAHEVVTDTPDMSDFDIFDNVHLLNPKDVVTLRDLTIDDELERYCHFVTDMTQGRHTVSKTMLSHCDDCKTRVKVGKSSPSCKHHAYKESKQERHELAHRKRKLYPFLEKNDPRLFLYDEEILFNDINLNSETFCLPHELKPVLRNIILKNKEAFSLHGETGNADHTV